MHCSKCEAENPDNARFCVECASPFAQRCPSCHAENPASAKCCSQCATELTSATPLREQPHGSLAGERRHLTVLFCDLVSSTTLAAQLDPEEWRETVAGYHRAAGEAITRFAGHVAKYLGDGVMAFFGYPEAHDNDAECAARAGLAILESVAKLREPPGHPKLSARVGIDSGAVVVGSGAGNDADVFGDTPNIAARVQEAAAPGTVVVTEEMHRLISGLFVVEACGAPALKGVVRPIQLYRVIQPSGVRGRLGAMAAVRGLTPFVGREDELRLLMSRWERVQEGEGQVALIVGEAGIGKSRLVHRFHELIADTSHTWIEASAAPFFQNTPFYPVSEMLKQALAWRGAETPERQLEQLESALELAGLKSVETVPLIAPLLNLPPAAKYPPPVLSPDQQRRRLLATLVELALGIARIQPAVIATDDLQWADPSTLELIKRLVEQGARARLLLVYTARPEFRAEWPLRAHHAQITLNRLNSRNVRMMVGQVAAQKALSEDTIAMVVERSGGVPLFVEELVRAVLEKNAQLSGREIPATLHNSLMARLDRLGPAKEVIQIGAVIGSEFSYELLHAVYPVAEVERALGALADAELLYVRGIAPQASYQFKHALIRDAAYEALLKSRRRDLHRQVARTIDEQFTALKDAHPEVLARHWTEAGETEPAITEWQKAGEQAVRSSAYHEAVSHFEAALRIVETLPESPQRNRQELRLRAKLRDPLIASKGYTSAEVQEMCDRARELCRGMGDGPEIFATLGGLNSVYFNRGELSAALELAQQMLRIGESSKRASFLLWAHYAMGFVLHALGENVSARDHLEQSVALYDRRRGGAYGFVQDPGPTSLLLLAHTVYDLGYPDLAVSRAIEGLRLARELSHPFTLAWVLNSSAFLLRLRGDMRGAASLCEEGIAIRTKHGFAFEDTTVITQGWIRTALGETEEGIARIRQGITIAEDNSRSYVHGLMLLADSLGVAGRPDEGLALIEEALGKGVIGRLAIAWLYQLRGDLLLKLSAVKEAEQSFRMSIDVARGTSGKQQELVTTSHLARLLASQGHRDSARTMLAQIYGCFTEGFDTADLKDAKALLDELG